MFYLLDITDCGDYTVAYALSVVQRVLSIFQIVVPILLIIALIISLIKLFTGPDDNKKAMKGIIAKIVGIVVFFALPWIVGLVLDMITFTNQEDGGARYTLGSCWDYAEEIRSQIDETPDQTVGNGLDKSNISDHSNIKDGISGATPKDKNDPNLKRVVIGDSRVVQMCTSYKLCGSDEVVAAGGKGLGWFKLTGEKTANTYLSGEKKAVFVLLGVNDVGSSKDYGKSQANTYFSYFSNLASNGWSKHMIYFVSINGVIDGKSGAYTAAVNAFNSQIKQKIESSSLKNFQYCDTASKITVDITTAPDGLHYTSSTYQKIYKAMLSCMGA